MSKAVQKNKRKAPNVKSIPWDVIRAEFIADETLTQSVLAKKYGISRSSVQKKASAEDWQSLRRVSTELTIEKITEDKKAAISDANKRHAEGAQVLQEAALKGIEWINSFSDTMTKGKKKTKVADNVPGPVLFSKALSELVASYSRAANLERAVLGIATTVSKLADEDGEEQPMVFDIMGGVANASRNSRDDNSKASS